METINPGMGQDYDDNEPQVTFRDSRLGYRHWFIIALLLLVNIIILGCVFLAITGRIRWGY